MPPGLSPVHLLVILAVALIVLGPEKGPEAIGKGARMLGEARQWMARASEELQRAVSLQIEEPRVPTADVPTAPPGEVASDAGRGDRQPRAEVATPPEVQPVSNAAAVAGAIPASSPPGPADAGHPPGHQEPHL